MKQSLTHEQLRLLVATMINDENTDYAQTTARLNPDHPVEPEFLVFPEHWVKHRPGSDCDDK